MSKNKGNRNNEANKKAAKLSKKIDERAMNQQLACKEMADPLQTVSDHLTKRFKIKKVEKPVKKMLKTGCIHWYINHKGKMKFAAKANSNGTATCPICGRTFSTQAMSLDEFDQITDNMRQLNDQIGFAKGMLRLGTPAIRSHYAQMIREEKWAKVNRKVLALALKDGELDNGKKGKKGNNHGGNGGGLAGSWN